MLRFALYGFASLCLREGNCHMSRFALFYSCEMEAVTRYVCFRCLVLVCFVLLVQRENYYMLRLVLHCVVSLRFPLLCFALHYIAQLSSVKKQTKNIL